MKIRSGILVAALMFITASMPLAAHHSMSGTYDVNKVMTITGVIKEIVWRNPHAAISMNVKSADGKIVNWMVEIGAPNRLRIDGFDRTLLDLSSTYTMEIWPARDGSQNASGRSLTLSDGRKFDVSAWWVGDLSLPNTAPPSGTQKP